MKATMSANGVVTLKAENSLEAYAMRQWMKTQRMVDSDNPAPLEAIDHSMLCIDASWPANLHDGGESPSGIIDIIEFLGQKL
jgi:hypothetical protein